MLPISDFKYLTRQKTASSIRPFKSGENPLSSGNSLGRVKIKFLIVLAIALAVIFGIQLVIATNLSTDGQTLSAIDEEIRNEETKNLELRTKIAQFSSLSYLSQKAQQLGFTNPDKIIAP